MLASVIVDARNAVNLVSAWILLQIPLGELTSFVNTMSYKPLVGISPYLQLQLQFGTKMN